MQFRRYSIISRYSLFIVISTVLLITACAVLPFFTHAGAAENGNTRTLYLIRHGAYDEDDERDPDTGKALVPLGIAQAKLIGARLCSIPVEYTSLHSSTMTRARETAMVIGEELPHLELEQWRILRECTPATWREDIMVELEEGEADDCERQLEEAYERFFTAPSDDDKHDVIVCHGNVIRYFITKVLKVDSMSWLQMSIANCSLTIVRINDDGSMKLLCYGDIGHIPANMQTGLSRDRKQLDIPGK